MAKRQCRVPPFWSFLVLRRSCNVTNGAFDGGEDVLVDSLAALPDIGTLGPPALAKFDPRTKLRVEGVRNPG